MSQRTTIYHPIILGLQQVVGGDATEWLAAGWLTSPPAVKSEVPTPSNSALMKHKAVGE